MSLASASAICEGGCGRNEGTRTCFLTLGMPGLQLVLRPKYDIGGLVSHARNGQINERRKKKKGTRRPTNGMNERYLQLEFTWEESLIRTLQRHPCATCNGHTATRTHAHAQTIRRQDGEKKMRVTTVRSLRRWGDLTGGAVSACKLATTRERSVCLTHLCSSHFSGKALKALMAMVTFSV